MRRPFRTACGSLLVAGALLAAGALVLGPGRGPDVTYAATAHVAIARTQGQERAMAATATTQRSPGQLAGDYLAALEPAAIEISKVTAALKALSITATFAQVQATVKPLGDVLSPLDRLQGLPAPGAGTTGLQTNAVKLPERLGPFEDVVTVVRGYHRASATARQAHMERDTSRLTLAAYRRAYPGAAVAYRGYANASLSIFTYVVAVRAPSPGLTIGAVGDPADLGLAMDENTAESFGDVSCVVTTQDVVLAGKPVKPSSLIYGQCQRSGPHLSVFVRGSGLQGDGGRDAIVAETNAAYNAVAGS